MNLNEDKRKLIVFVDELDRCRPPYAIEILECIKHLFNINGIVFVLAIDEGQLRGSIESVYGIKRNGESYLRKFIDWRLNLPKPSHLKYSEYLFKKFGLDEMGKFKSGHGLEDGRESLIESFGFFCYTFNLTLREQSQCFTEINLCIRSLDKTERLETFLTGLIPVLRLKHKKVLEECLEGKTDPEILIEIIESEVDVPMVRKILNNDWPYFTKFIHAFFINSGFRASLDKELSELQSQQDVNLPQSKGPKFLERIDYVRNVIEAHKHLRSGNHSYEIPAKIVYKRFELAAKITQF